MAYGQTGSGKSFTMQEDPDNIGKALYQLHNWASMTHTDGKILNYDSL